MEEDLSAKIAKLEVKTDKSEHELIQIEEDIKEIKIAVSRIDLVLAERKGGTRYLMVLLTVASGVGALVTQLLNALKII